MNTSDVTLDMTKRLAGAPIILILLRRGPITSDGRFDELRDSLLSSILFGDDDMVVVWLLEGCSGVLLTTMLLIFCGAFTTVLASREPPRGGYFSLRRKNHHLVHAVLEGLVPAVFRLSVAKILFSIGRGTTICRALPTFRIE